MEFKDLDSGMRLEALVTKRGVRENLRLNGALEAYAELELKYINLEDDVLKADWSGLLLTREGVRNSRTFRCLDALGCVDGDVVKWLNEDFKPRSVQVVIGERPNKQHPLQSFKYIEWINRLPSTQPNGNVIDRLKKAGLGAPIDKNPFMPKPSGPSPFDSGKKDDPEGLPF